MPLPSLIARRQLLGWLAVTAAYPSAAAPKSKQPTAAKSSVLTGAALMKQVNAATDTPTLAEGTQGEAVWRAQILLDQAWFSVGEIDGTFGANMRHVVTAFQTANKLQPSGRLDANTWKALSSKMPAAVLSNYTITRQDTFGPFIQLPADMAGQAQLSMLGYSSLLEALSEKFHCSPAWLHAANQDSTFRAGDQIVVPALENSKPAPLAASIRIEKSERMLLLLDKAGQWVGAFPISIGSASDPLPVGLLEIKTAVKNPMFALNPTLLKGAKNPDINANIAPGPNNPVGVYWLGLNKPHWGIHGTPEPGHIGQAETNGCIRLTNWDVLRVTQVVQIGFVVDVRG